MKYVLQLGKEIVRAIDSDDFPQNVRDHALHKGFENIIKDCHAGYTKKDNPTDYRELSEQAVDKKIAALRNGETRMARGPVDVKAMVLGFLKGLTDEERAELVASMATTPVEKKKRA